MAAGSGNFGRSASYLALPCRDIYCWPPGAVVSFPKIKVALLICHGAPYNRCLSGAPLPLKPIADGDRQRVNARPCCPATIRSAGAASACPLNAVARAPEQSEQPRRCPPITHGAWQSSPPARLFVTLAPQHHLFVEEPLISSIAVLHDADP